MVEKAITRTSDCKLLPDSVTMGTWHMLIVGESSHQNKSPKEVMASLSSDTFQE